MHQQAEVQQSEAMKLIPFKRGIPTKLDVEKLIKRFGVPIVGSVIEYADIEKELGTHRRSHRFGSVVTAWRKRLDRENNLVLAGNRMGGFEVLTAKRRVSYSSAGFKIGMKKVLRSADIACRTNVDELDAGERRVVDHIVQTSGLLQSVAHSAAKELGKPKLGIVGRCNPVASEGTE